MEEDDHYEMDDSDAEAAMPPSNLMQTAREILARPVTPQELARAWDRSSHLPTEDRRVAACLDQLLSSYGSDAEDAPQDVAHPTVAVQAPARPATPRTSTQERRPVREVIDLSLDDDDTSPEKPYRPPTKRKRAREDEDTTGGDRPPENAKVRRTAAVETGQRNALKEEREDVVPDWLLQQFRAVAAAAPAPAPAPAPKAASPVALKLPVTGQGTQATVHQHSKNTSPPILDAPVALEPTEPSPLASILAIIPDVDIAYATKLIGRYSNDPATCVEHVIDVLLADKSYPKAQISSDADNKGKSKALEEDDLLLKLKAYLDKDTRARTERIPTFTYREAA
jgi:hypothetical protein